MHACTSCVHGARDRCALRSASPGSLGLACDSHVATPERLPGIHPWHVRTYYVHGA
uniref:Uncharacterized protein n=1 Tax=Triticum urartu TaxID=4572 RepID=A0A8R7Q1D6_TRIUA